MDEQEDYLDSYVAKRQAAGESSEAIIESFGVSALFLRGLATQQSPSDDRQRAQEEEQPQQEQQEPSLHGLSLKYIIRRWVQHQREREEADALASAVVSGRLQEACRLLDTGVPWDAETEGVTCGELALFCGQDELFSLLVSRGASDIHDRAKRLQRLEGRGARPERMLAGPATYEESEEGKTLVEACGMPVMMPWEASLMKAHALRFQGLQSVLNVGFGSGYVDTYIQELTPPPTSHSIIEAHPDVVKRCVAEGWRDKPGVQVYEGRWQEVIPRLADQSLDAIFYDTHDEGLEALLEVAVEAKRLLRPGGVFSFWNGWEAFNLFRHAALCEGLARYWKASLGMDLSFERVPVMLRSEDWGRWSKAKLAYFNFKTYFLPTCVFPGATLEASALPQPLSSSSQQIKRERGEGQGDWPNDDETTSTGFTKQRRISMHQGPVAPETGAATVTVGDLAPWMVDGIQRAASASRSRRAT